MWFCLVISLALFFLIRWFLERQTVESLREKYVFITGCDSGFGNQLAQQLDLQGMRILAGCLTQKGAEELERVTSDRLKTIVLDVTSTESIAMATEWVKGHVKDKAPNEWLTKSDFVKVLDVNLVGLIDVTLHMLPLVKKAKGRVVNVASILGRLAFFGGGYCPSKYGVEAFSDCLRRELRPFGVKIAMVEPGYFRTGMTNIEWNLNELEQIWTNVPQETKNSYGQAYFDNYYKMFKEGIVNKCSTDLYLVTDCMEHALTSKHPRTRYSGGWDAQFLYIPLSYLPTVLADFVLTWSWPKSVRAA
ncbi:17-beta-hydroxysteroid dehydrogenase type 6 isoform X2 [Heteronotia binoei]|uniref:17-beta-hydroxysteroid dehydrogenase type 6 isoform X2 n=1 Tax=Heteronotia binoei TaxID=13085 RepID=UPI00292FFC25|nr:17-beta-hydroxysteroid dehydrogenase type 6 isoform X2 [Heteronotia binoei]